MASTCSDSKRILVRPRFGADVDADSLVAEKVGVVGFDRALCREDTFGERTKTQAVYLDGVVN